MCSASKKTNHLSERINDWEVTCDGLASHPGGVAILLVASCYGNRDKLLLYGPLGSCADFTFVFSIFYQVKLHEQVKLQILITFSPIKSKKLLGIMLKS